MRTVPLLCDLGRQAIAGGDRDELEQILDGLERVIDFWLAEQRTPLLRDRLRAFQGLPPNQSKTLIPEDKPVAALAGVGRAERVVLTRAELLLLRAVETATSDGPATAGEIRVHFDGRRHGRGVWARRLWELERLGLIAPATSTSGPWRLTDHGRDVIEANR